MIGIPVNTAAVALGGILGALLGKWMSPEFSQAMNRVFGVCSIGMGVISVVEMRNMPAVILAVVLGTAVGLSCKLSQLLLCAGTLLQKPAGKMMKVSGDVGMPTEKSLSLLLTAIVLFCFGGTGIYGCLDAGMTGSGTILLSKSVLDLFTAMVFACSLGVVVSLVAIPQLVFYTLLFLAARLIFPLTTPDMIADFKACGGFLLIATGFRVAGIQDFPIADMIPAMALVMPLSGLWTSVLAPLI